MSDKKVEFSEMAKSISTLVSAVVKNIQNGLGSFEKSSDFENFFKDIYGGKTIEIEKIKFILKEVIKKREKMGKKSSAKKVRREIENFEKNKVKDLEIKEEKILVQDINLKELSKYEKIKKFRNLENINITYGDNEKDKFKDFQEIYNLISNEIVIQRKREIYSKKDKIFYFLQHKLFTTERLKGEYSIFTSNKEEKNNLNNIKKISNRIREKGIEFSLPDEKSIKLLKNTGFIGNGCWIYYYKENNISYSNYMRISDTYNYSLDCQYEYNLLGIYKLDKFFNFLKILLN